MITQGISLARVSYLAWLRITKIRTNSTVFTRGESVIYSPPRMDVSFLFEILNVQFSHSVVSDSWDPMDCSTPGFPVHHGLQELTQTHVHWVDDIIQLSHPLSFPSPPALKSFPASGSFPMSQPFASGGQRIAASASASVFPEKCTGLISFGINWSDLLAVQGVLKHLLCCCCC